MGTSMTDDVVEFSARVNTVALRAYSAAVGRRTQEVVRGLSATHHRPSQACTSPVVRVLQIPELRFSRAICTTN
jgi:hypothetical protein